MIEVSSKEVRDALQCILDAMGKATHVEVSLSGPKIISIDKFVNVLKEELDKIDIPASDKARG